MMFDLQRQVADAVGGPSGDRYDALLDTYEPDETAGNVEKVFAELKDPLIDLVARIKESGRTPRRELLARHYPAGRQMELSTKAATACGFDFEAGRIDTAVHPFCTGLGPGDTRMTTRFDENVLATASSARSTRPATPFTSKTSRKTTTSAPAPASRSAWASTRARAASGRTSSAEAGRSGSISTRSRRACSPTPSAASRWTTSCSP